MNLLITPVLSVEHTDRGRIQVDLPTALEYLSQDKVRDFPALRPHQAPALHVLLVQLATLAALRRDGAIPQDADGWRLALRRLTLAFPNDEPWCLAVEDWTLPAFLQPPCPSAAKKSDYKREYRSADALDVLVTSKNHDQKAERMVGSSAEEWLFTLINLQTTQGYYGTGNYGIARMNAGHASRAVVRCAPASLGLGGQIFRDVSALIARQEDWRAQSHSLRIGTRAPTHELLWLLPWDGTESLSLEHFHPLTVEICRRVRLTQIGEQWLAQSAGSKVARVAAKDARGIVADPWIPVDRIDPKAFNVTREGFSFRRVVALLDTAKYERPLLAKPSAAETRLGQAISVSFAALARGEGETEGFHDRRVFLSPGAAARFASDDPSFIQRSARFVSLAADASGKSLRPALIHLVQGKEEPVWNKPTNAALVDPWIREFEANVDQAFFQTLSQSFESTETDADAETIWSKRLEQLALDVFHRAANGVPRTDQRRILTMARALSFLRSALYKNLPGTRRSNEEPLDE